MQYAPFNPLRTMEHMLKIFQIRYLWYVQDCPDFVENVAMGKSVPNNFVIALTIAS